MIQKRILGLDILRTIAILIVVYNHGLLLLPKQFMNFALPTQVLDGVAIFFVLSGYLIGNILLKIIERSEFKFVDLLNFWTRRWFRTLPAYFLILAVLVVFQYHAVGNFNWLNWKYLLFFQNFISPHPLFFPEAWSLCIEEWFYLSFPIVCYFVYKILKNKKWTLLFSALIFLIFPLILRVISLDLHHGLTDWDSFYRKVTIFRLDSLMYGIIGAYIFKFKNDLWIKYKNYSFVLGVILIVYLCIFVKIYPHDLLFLTVYNFNLQSIATLLLLPLLSSIKNIKIRFISLFFTFISVISYSMYLVNLTLIQKHLLPITSKLINLNQNYLLTVILYLFYTILLSFLIYRFFEKPITDLRDKFSKS